MCNHHAMKPQDSVTASCREPTPSSTCWLKAESPRLHEIPNGRNLACFARPGGSNSSHQTHPQEGFSNSRDCAKGQPALSDDLGESGLTPEGGEVGPIPTWSPAGPDTWEPRCVSMGRVQGMVSTGSVWSQP